MPRYLKLKGLIESNDGGDTWFISRIWYLTGGDNEREQDFINVPDEWKPYQLVLKRIKEENFTAKTITESEIRDQGFQPESRKRQIPYSIVKKGIERKKKLKEKIKRSD